MQHSSASEPDPFAAMKQGVRWMWSLGDYPALAKLLEPPARLLAAGLDLHQGVKVLDVAAGNGNFAIAAAERGAMVTACDIAPAMLELGRERSTAAGLPIEWQEADAEELPFPDGSFDVVASVFGAIFAPRPERVAKEMFRVARPGGKVAMANYAERGFLGAFARLMARYSRPAPFPMPSPFEWGDEAELRRRLEPYARSLELRRGELRFEFASVEAGLRFWERTNPPLMALRAAVSGEDYARMIAEARQLMEEMNAARDRLVLVSEYLIVYAEARG